MNTGSIKRTESGQIAAQPAVTVGTAPDGQAAADQSRSITQPPQAASISSGGRSSLTESSSRPLSSRSAVAVTVEPLPPITMWRYSRSLGCMVEKDLPEFFEDLRKHPLEARESWFMAEDRDHVSNFTQVVDILIGGNPCPGAWKTFFTLIGEFSREHRLTLFKNEEFIRNLIGCPTFGTECLEWLLRLTSDFGPGDRSDMFLGIRTASYSPLDEDDEIDSRDVHDMSLLTYMVFECLSMGKAEREAGNYLGNISKKRKESYFGKIFGQILNMLMTFRPSHRLEALLELDHRNRSVFSYMAWLIRDSSVWYRGHRMIEASFLELERTIRENFDEYAMFLLMQMMKHSQYFGLGRMFALVEEFSRARPEVFVKVDDRGQSIFMHILSNLANAESKEEKDGLVEKIFDIIATLDVAVQRDMITRPDMEGNTLLEHVLRFYDEFPPLPSEEPFLFSILEKINDFGPDFLREKINGNGDFIWTRKPRNERGWSVRGRLMETYLDEFQKPEDQLSKLF
ncbi:MAG: hypothetical protein LBS87_02815, partial [Puniceicoccales bacterium]|nr:hypothetical protein [Puniceicoccales bacterium]